MQITSLTNAKVKQWVKYHEKKYRDKDGKFLVEGEHLIEEAIQAGLIECIICEIGYPNHYDGYPTYEVTKEIMNKISVRDSKANIMAVVHYPNIQKDSSHILMCDGVQDPGNLGTLIRTACSFGYDTIVLSNKCADVFNEKVIRSTQGALFHVAIQRGSLIDMIDAYRKDGYHIYATALQNAKPLQEVSFHFKHVLIVGNEGSGVTQEVLAQADQSIYIEMKTFESLNVAIAGAICMYELTKEE